MFQRTGSMWCKLISQTSRLLLAAGCWSFLCGVIFAQPSPPSAAAIASSVAAPKFILAHTLSGHKRFLSAVAFSPEGSLLATGSWDGTARLWDVASGKEVRTLLHHKMAVTSVAFSPDGRWLASGGGSRVVQFWDVTTGEKLGTLSGHSGAIESVAVSRDGRWLASASDDNTAKLWRWQD